MNDSRLGPNRIDRELGSGGMGKAYAAGVDGQARGKSPDELERVLEQL